VSHTSFADLGLASPLLRAISDSGYDQPTAVQAQSIPKILQGHDLLAAAQTGTGKTAAFTLPILHFLLSNPLPRKPAGTPRVLVLTPTRELAAQVEASIREYARYSKVSSLRVFGGVNINPQIKALTKPLDILVATPGRLLDHCRQKTVDLSRIEVLILDEADRMLDMGFMPDIKRIQALLPKQRQTLLFSATFADEIRQLAKSLLHQPKEVTVNARNSATTLITQNVVFTPQEGKRDLVGHIISQKGWHQVLVFTRTKHGANRLTNRLNKQGLTAAAIHGNKSQNARTRALNSFKKGQIPILVATDIAARGLDINQLPIVINYELPNVPEDYVHRIGRTGRAGSQGTALSLVAPSEIKQLKAIERLIKQPLNPITIEGWEAPVTIPDTKPKRRSRPRARKRTTRH